MYNIIENTRQNFYSGRAHHLVGLNKINKMRMHFNGKSVLRIRTPPSAP